MGSRHITECTPTKHKQLLTDYILNSLFQALTEKVKYSLTPSKLKCGIPIWENSEEYWYLLLKKFVFPKVLAKWKKKKKCSVEFSKENTTSLTKTYNLCKKDRQSRFPF